MNNMPGLPAITAQSRDIQQIELGKVEVPGLTRLVAQSPQWIGSVSPEIEETVWCPSKLLLPDGINPVILKTSELMRLYVKIGQGYNANNTARRIARQIGTISDKTNEMAEEFPDRYSEVNAFSLSDLRVGLEFVRGVVDFLPTTGGLKRLLEFPAKENLIPVMFYNLGLYQIEN